MITSGQCKLIHHAKRRLGLDEETYRAILQRIAGVRSSKELDAASFGAVMDEIERLGFKTVGSAPQYGKRLGMATPAQINKIRSLFRKYSGSEDESRLEHWLDKHFHVSSLRFLDSATAPKVIKALENMAEWRKTHPHPHSDRPSHPVKHTLKGSHHE